MTETENKITEQLRLISSQLARIELRQAEVAGRVSALERYTVNTERLLGELNDGNVKIAADIAAIGKAVGEHRSASGSLRVSRAAAFPTPCKIAAGRIAAKSCWIKSNAWYPL